MKRKILIGLLALPLLLFAQGQGMQVGLRGGAATWQTSSAYQWAPEGGIDLRYTARWRVRPYTQLGLITGVDATYSAYQLSGDFTHQFTRQDYLGNTIEYTTSAQAKERHSSIGLSVPVLFAFQTRGMALHIGPKLHYTAYDGYQQTIDNAQIDAYFPAYKVHVTNAPSTGLLTTPYTQSGKNTSSALQIQLAAEIGYEWQLGNPYSRYSEKYIGVHLYANYGVWQWTNQPQEAVVSVASIQASSTEAPVIVRSMGIAQPAFSLGVRLYYTFQSVDYPGRGWHRYHK